MLSLSLQDSDRDLRYAGKTRQEIAAFPSMIISSIIDAVKKLAFSHDSES